jgi:hypothetical protein
VTQAAVELLRARPHPLQCECGCWLYEHGAGAAESDGRKSYRGCRIHPGCERFRNHAGEIFHAGQLKPGMR